VKETDNEGERQIKTEQAQTEVNTNKGQIEI
jgi:hypothetical protein